MVSVPSYPTDYSYTDGLRHGLGDTALSEGIAGFIDDIKAIYPGIFIHSVQIPQGGNADAERKAGFVS